MVLNSLGNAKQILDLALIKMLPDSLSDKMVNFAMVNFQWSFYSILNIHTCIKNNQLLYHIQGHLIYFAYVYFYIRGHSIL